MSKMIESYIDLNHIIFDWSGEICIFGAGNIGKGYAYDFLKGSGMHIDFYCDNSLVGGEEVIDSILSRPVKYIYDHKDTVFVLICLGYNNRKEVSLQLEEGGFKNYAFINWNIIARVLETVDKADNTIKQQYHAFYDNKAYLKYRYKLETGFDLEIDNPKTFNEKLQWLKLNGYKPGYTKYTDKAQFKDYIKRRYGEKYVIPTIGEWERYDDIDFEALPDRFVLKCTHDSGSIVLVNGQQNLDHSFAHDRLDGALAIDYYWLGREWTYRNAERRIIAEQFVQDDYGELRDYKVFCFNGKARLVQVDLDRYTRHRRNIYDLDWNYLPLSILYPTAPEANVEKPVCFDEMIAIAEELSENIIHVRVDFYAIGKHPVVGEMTFFHGGGYERFKPNDWNYKMGEYIGELFLH
jgi:hypothetical protein